MAHLFLIFLMLLGASPGQERPAEERPAAAPWVERQQKQFNFYPGGKLQVRTGVAGSVRIIGWRRSSILVEEERVFRDLEPEHARVLSEQYPTVVRWTQTSARIQTAGPPETAAKMEVHLVLYVPREKTDVTAQILRGDFAFGAANGWVEANLEEGNIEAKPLGGYFSAVTKRGDVLVELSAKRWDGRGCTVATHGGSVTLRLPIDFSAALQLETRDGEIAIDFPEQVVEGESTPLHVVTKKKTRSLTASVGDGGSPIRCLTVSGDIRLEAFRPEVEREGNP